MKIRIKQNIVLTKARDAIGKSIQKDKEYMVVGLDDQFYRIINDYGEPILYPKHIFEVLDDTLPQDWVKRKYKGKEHYIGPAFAIEPGFYEDFFDRKKYAIKAFRKYVLSCGYMSEEEWNLKWVGERLVDNYGFGQEK